MRGNRGINRIARAIDKRISSLIASPDALELGTIQDDMSLLIDRFPDPFPAGEYLICRTLTQTEPFTTTVEGQGQHGHGPSGGHAQYSGDGVHSHPSTEGGHVHDVVTPSKLAPLAPGDRVLVAWVNNNSDGAEPVVIDVVVDSLGV